MVTLLIFGLLCIVIPFVAVVAVILFFWRRNPRPGRSARRAEDASVGRSTTYLGGPDEVPLSQRRVTLKVCTECRELNPIADPRCKYCGAELPVPSEAAAAQPSLRLPRKAGPASDHAPLSS